MKENPNNNQLTKQEKIDLLNKVLGTEICFLCGGKCGVIRDREKSTQENVLPLCSRCYRKVQLWLGEV